MVRVTSHKRWYHGTSRVVDVVKPGMPTRYRQDLPRWNAVYVTSDLSYARQYGDVVLEVEVDESRLLPDEDSVFGLLETWRPHGKHTPLERKVQKAYRDYAAETCAAEFGVYEMDELCEETRNATVDEAMEGLHNYFEEMGSDPFSTGTAEKMKDFAEWISKHRQQLSKEIIDHSISAAHIGSVRVKRVVGGKT